MLQDWKRVEEYKRRLGNFKHPIAPTDAQSTAGDVLSWLAQYGGSSQSYGRALVAMRIAMENGADPNEGGGMPLRYIVGTDKWGKMVERLLQAGAKPDQPKGHRPLHIAIEWDRTPSVGHLLAYGADPNVLVGTRFYRRPSPGFRMPGRDEWAQTKNAYPTRFEKTYYLSIAARKGDAEVAKLLLAKGAKINAREPATGRTALHEAAETDRPEIVKILLRAKASRSVKDKAGRTPLQAAKRFGAKRAIAALKG